MVHRGSNGLLAAALGAAVAVAAAVGRCEDQPQWGQAWTRNLVSEERGLPDAFDPETGRNVKWRAALGTQTHSTPIVAGGRVLIGTNNERPRDPRLDGDYGVLMCFNEADGRFLWQLAAPKLGSIDPYLDWPRTGMVSPATVEGDRVYMMTNRNEVVCLDLDGQADGNDGPYRDEGAHMAPDGARPLDITSRDADIIWLFDIRRQAGVHPHDGSHGSILIHGDYLYVCTSNGVDRTHRAIPKPDAPSLIVLDKRTGRLVARDRERMAPRTIHCTWSSPSLGRVAGGELVFFGGGDAVCYAFRPFRPEAAAAGGEPAALERVWRFDCDPAAPKENIFRWQDNRREGPSTIIGMPVFHKGRVYVVATGDLWHGKPETSLKCIRAAGRGDITRTGEVWSAPLERHCMGTPAIADGLVFVSDCGRTLHCLDAETGRSYWTHRGKGQFWASPLVADGKVYVGTRSGDFWILAADKTKRVISSIDLGAPISGTATAANGTLYVATADTLYALARP